MKNRKKRTFLRTQCQSRKFVPSALFESTVHRFPKTDRNSQWFGSTLRTTRRTAQWNWEFLFPNQKWLRSLWAKATKKKHSANLHLRTSPREGKLKQWKWVRFCHLTPSGVVGWQNWDSLWRNKLSDWLRLHIRSHFPQCIRRCIHRRGFLLVNRIHIRSRMNLHKFTYIILVKLHSLLGNAHHNWCIWILHQCSNIKHIQWGKECSPFSLDKNLRYTSNNEFYLIDRRWYSFKGMIHTYKLCWHQNPPDIIHKWLDKPHIVNIWNHNRLDR